MRDSIKIAYNVLIVVVADALVVGSGNWSYTIVSTPT